MKCKRCEIKIKDVHKKGLCVNCIKKGNYIKELEATKPFAKWIKERGEK
jgi:hypothetical protein